MNKKLLIIKIVTFLSGLYFFLEFVLPETFWGGNAENFHEGVSLGFIAIGGVAIGLGVINLLILHLDKIFLKKKGAFFSAALLISLFLAHFIFVLNWVKEEKIVSRSKNFQTLSEFSKVIVKDFKENKQGVLKKEERNKILVSSILKEFDKANLENLNTQGENFSENEKQELLEKKHNILKITEKIKENNFDIKFNLPLSKGLGNFSVIYKEALLKIYSTSSAKKLYTFCYEGLFNPLVTAMFSLLGFYVATAAFRAFKIKSFESLLMMVAAVVVIFGQIPFGVKIWGGFPALRLWLLRVPSTAAFRAIALGALVAGLVMALRMWFSLEQSESRNTKNGGEKD